MARSISNDFSWSKSRHEKFRECLRAYYLHYYRSWGGWDLAAAPEVRELYVLKKLDSRFTWSGTVVHDVIKRALTRIRQGREVTAAREIDRAHRLMRHDWHFSSSRAFWYQKYRKDFAGLVEHEYAVPVPRELWQSNWETARAALEWFFESRWIRIARSLTRAQWLLVDEDDLDKASFPLEGVRVFAVPDFAYREADGTPVVVDWKTGQSREGYDEQVLGYALYVSARYGVPVEKVRGSLVFLNERMERTVAVDAGALEGFLGRFRESVAQMRSLLRYPGANVPKEEAAFPRTEQRELCRGCVFRRPCGRDELGLTTRPPPLRTAQASLDLRGSAL